MPQENRIYSRKLSKNRTQKKEEPRKTELKDQLKVKIGRKNSP